MARPHAVPGVSEDLWTCGRQVRLEAAATHSRALQAGYGFCGVEGRRHAPWPLRS